MREGDSILSQAWCDGATIEISGGFGSKFDMGVYHGVVCDECIEKNATRIKQVVNTKNQTTTEYKDGLYPDWFENKRYR